MLQLNDAETISHPRSLIFGAAALPWRRRMQSKIIGTELPSGHFQPRVYGVGAWTDHLHFGYDLVAIIEVASLRLTCDGVVRFQAANEKAFATILCSGDGERLPDFSFLRLRITGMDPQLYLPAMESTPGERLALEMHLRVLPDQAALSEMSPRDPKQLG